MSLTGCCDSREPDRGGVADGHSVWICEDDALYAASLPHGLPDGLCVHTFADGPAILAALERRLPDLILLDLGLPGSMDGFAVLGRIRARWPRVPVVVHSGRSDHAAVVRAMRLGAVDYVLKGGEPAELAAHLAQHLPGRPRHLQAGPGELEVPCGDHAVQILDGDSPQVADLHRVVARLRRFPGNVVITGAPGVGKERVARAFRCANRPFVSVDAATLQEATAVSVLFGHERGAFTGADRARPGLLEAADGGVLYLDEVGNMALDVQAKLLRVLQEKEVMRLGATVGRRVELRVVCATNRDLAGMCQDGSFRADLYERLCVFGLDIPALVDRIGDVAPLARQLWARAGGPPDALEGEIMTCLLGYTWPGNVRELDNVLQYLRAMSDGGPAMRAHLPAKIRVAAAVLRTGTGPARGGSAYADQLRAFDTQVFGSAYADTGGNVSATARRLGLDRTVVHDKLVALGIHRPRER